MPRAAFSTAAAPQSKNPISQCVRTGPVVAASGQVGKLPDGTLPASIEEQAHAAFRNLIAVLAAGGAAESDVAHIRVYLTDHGDMPAVNEAFEATFSKPYPARTGIFVGLPPGILFEVDAIAVVE